MLFAGVGSVRILKNCDLGLENAARGRHSFSLYGPPSQQITYTYTKTDQWSENFEMESIVYLKHLT